MELASSSLMPVAEEVKPTPVAPPVIPSSRKSVTELTPFAPSTAPIPPRPPSSADIVTSAPAMPAARPVTPEPLTAPSPSAPSPSPPAELSDAAQEQLAAILHTVIESTLAPAIAKQKELEARLEALQKAPAVRVQSQSSLSPVVRSMSPNSAELSASTPPRPSMVSTSYGLVSVMPGPAPRPAIEEALERVGPIDVPDFAGKRKFAGGIVIAILIIGVVGAILATILSYS